MFSRIFSVYSESPGHEISFRTKLDYEANFIIKNSHRILKGEKIK
jgi:hypothetical protein